MDEQKMKELRSKPFGELKPEEQEMLIGQGKERLIAKAPDMVRRILEEQEQEQK